jgi:hypothetical protein
MGRHFTALGPSRDFEPSPRHACRLIVTLHRADPTAASVAGHHVAPDPPAERARQLDQIAQRQEGTSAEVRRSVAAAADGWRPLRPIRADHTADAAPKPFAGRTSGSSWAPYG